MKTMKRVFAVLVAVLLIAMMIPAVSAAENTVNWRMSNSGFKYDVYKIADYDATTGTFSTTYDALKSEVTANKEETAALAAACKNVTFNASDKVTSFTSTEDNINQVNSFTVGDGIFYIKLAEVTNPDYAGAATQESVVVFPQKNKTTSTDVFNLDNKIKKENEPSVSKFFKVGNDETQEAQSFGNVIDKTITYSLHAELPKTAVENFIIVDTMGTGLNETKHDVTGVQLLDKDGQVLTESVAYTVTKAEADIKVTGKNGKTTDGTFGVKITDPAALDYTAGNYICVTYTTELSADALINTAIPNTVDLVYGNEFNNVVNGNTVDAFTYAAQAIKVDASSATTKLGRATFELYASDKSTKLATAVTAESGADLGIAKFDVKLKAGTYYVKETTAPEGYNLNSSWSEPLVVGPETPTGSVTIADTKAKIPSTGGNGTMVFTIVGGSLVLLAAALFAVVMKKKSSAK